MKCVINQEKLNKLSKIDKIVKLSKWKNKEHDMLVKLTNWEPKLFDLNNPNLTNEDRLFLEVYNNNCRTIFDSDIIVRKNIVNDDIIAVIERFEIEKNDIREVKYKWHIKPAIYGLEISLETAMQKADAAIEELGFKKANVRLMVLK